MFFVSDVIGEVASHSKYGNILVELKLGYIMKFVRRSEERDFYISLFPCSYMNTDTGARTQFLAS